MMISGLGYFAIDTSESVKWHELLTDVLGMGAEQGSGVTFYRLDEWHHRLAVYEADREAVRAVGWQLDNEAALGDMLASLEAAGVAPSPMSQSVCEERRVTAGYQFIDPVSSMPTEIFYGPVYEQLPFTPSEGISGYWTGEDGLGHVVYFVEDYERAKRFYTEAMGFRVSDRIVWDDGEKDATFFHCNPRHHSLAVMPPFGDIPPGTFNHLMLQGRSINDVGIAYDRVRDLGIPLMMELGKHTNDLTESFYLVTPSGFALEFGCNSLRVGNNWQVKTYDAPMIWGHRAP
jgi:2,3-dihydroxybiphenyl 1,2-dioxygenase